MGNAYITEAFKQFNLLEDTFPVNAEGVEDMQNFLDVAGEDVDDEQVIYDLEAEAEEDLKQSYVGKVILDCNVCHSNVFIDKEEVTINEDGVANIDTECPYCMSNEGYVIIGEVKPYSEYEKDENLTQDDLPVEVDDEPIELGESFRRRLKESKKDSEFEKEVDKWLDEIMSNLSFEEFEEWVEEFKDRKLGISESYRRRLKESARDDIIDLSDNLDEWGQTSLFKSLIKWLPEDTLAAFLDDFKRDYDLEESLDKTGTEKLSGSDKIGGVKALNGREKLSGVKSLRGHDLKKDLHESYSVSAREDLIELAEYEPESVLEEVISYLSEDDCYNIMCALDPYYGMDDEDDDDWDEDDEDLEESLKRRKLKEDYSNVEIGLYGDASTFETEDEFNSFLEKCKKKGIKAKNIEFKYDDWEVTLVGDGGTIYKLASDLPGYQLDASPNEWIDEYRVDDLDESFSRRKGKWLKEARSKKDIDSELNESLDEVAPDLDRFPIIEFNNGMYYNIDYQGGKLIAGSATNTGIIPEYEIEYDHDDSFDENLQYLYDVIIEDNPQLLGESKESSKKYVVIASGGMSSDADSLNGALFNSKEEASEACKKWKNSYSKEDKKIFKPKTSIHVYKPGSQFDDAVKANKKNKNLGESYRIKLKENQRGKVYKPDDWNAKELLLSMLEEEDYWTKEQIVDKFYDWYDGEGNIHSAERLYDPETEPDGFCKNIIDSMSPQEAYRFCQYYNVDRFLEPNFDPDKPYMMREGIEDVSITTDGETMTMSTKGDGGIVLETSPKEEFTELDVDDDFGGSEEFGSDDEVIAPLEDEDVDELELNSEINDLEDEELEDVGEVEVDEFDEDSFDELGESYLRKVYENVNSFKTTSCSATPSKLMIEGVIKFNSGATKKTSFVFEAKTRKKGKCLFEGYNKQISRGKKTFKLNCSLKEKKLISKSLSYNYTSKNSLNESVRVNGTVKK